MGTIAAAAVELEAKRKDDSSWHPCQVSLSSDTSTSIGLIVDFGGQDCEEVIISKEEALARLRIRSTPLEGGECVHVKEGERVLASQETQFGIRFFDAEVEKVCRVRHSKRNQCRCTFEIKWLHLDLGAGTVTVPSSSIMKLATNTVDSHTMVVEFLNSVETFKCPGLSSFVSLFEETGFETDLEKQIEEISRLADVSGKECPKDGPLELKQVDLTGHVRHRTIASQVSFPHDQGPQEQTNSRRTTRSQKKIQLESEKIQPPPQLVTEEPDRTHLSPLGARAALASSLIYKLPSEPEFSAYDVESEGFASAVQRGAVNHTTMISLDFTNTYMDSDVRIQEEVSVKDDPLSIPESCPSSIVLKHAKVLASGRRGISNNSLQTTGMQNRLEKPTWTPNDARDMGSNVVTLKKGLACSLSDGKLETPMKTTRLTRSAIQKGMGPPNHEVELKSFEKMKLCGPAPTLTPRFTRSTIEKEIIDVTVAIDKGLQEKISAQGAESRWTSLTNEEGIGHSNHGNELKSSSEESKLSSPTHKLRSTRSAIQNEARTVTVEVNKGLQEVKLAHGTDSRLTRLSNQKGIGHSKDKIEWKSSSEEMKLRNSTHTPRFTRSAKHQEANTLTPEVNNRLQGMKLPQGTDSRLTCLTNQKGIMHLKDEIEMKSSSEETNLHNPTRTTRFTRSAIHKEARNGTMEVNKGPGESKLTQETCSNFTREDLVAPQTKETIRKKPLSSPSDVEINLSLTQESKKKQRVSNDIRITINEGEISKADSCLLGEKKSVTSNTKPKLRFSSRLRFLPGTRSQEKLS